MRCDRDARVARSDGVHGEQGTPLQWLRQKTLSLVSAAGEHGKPRDEQDLADLEVLPIHALIHVEEVQEGDVEFGGNGITGVAGLDGVGAWVRRGGGDGENCAWDEEIPFAGGNVGIRSDEDANGDVVGGGDRGGGVTEADGVRWHFDDGDDRQV